MGVRNGSVVGLAKLQTGKLRPVCYFLTGNSGFGDDSMARIDELDS